mmetsp:Transcript_64180/g.126060  ORF Transcript_64180/g.126060 Transcript_64180/m.126060 type:complete len:253 (-) Transcript_64180:385-1143(-)
MSRRSRGTPKLADVAPSVLTGLESLVERNEDMIRSMLDAEASSDLVVKLREVMGVNSLGVEMLLARFFSSAALSKYCVQCMGASGKGSESVLAARIAKAWNKPSFVALPQAPPPTKANESSAASETVEAPTKRAKKDGGGIDGGAAAKCVDCSEPSNDEATSCAMCSGVFCAGCKDLTPSCGSCDKQICDACCATPGNIKECDWECSQVFCLGCQPKMQRCHGPCKGYFCDWTDCHTEHNIEKGCHHDGCYR